MKVSAVIVSKMDRDIGEVVDLIAPHVEDLRIVRGRAGVFERWEAAAAARESVVYVQDDDALVDVPAVLAEYQAGVVTCNMPEAHRRDYPDGIALVGWGAVFDRNLVANDRSEAFNMTHWAGAIDAYFDWCNATGERRHLAGDVYTMREADRIFTGLSQLKLIDVPVAHLAQAHGKDRMSLDPRHGHYLVEIRRRIYAIRREMECS